ncbi:hypothetical protein D9757_008002 [Collybiopsis confluens]|uniref:Uncharacterized protein n=1 Tax=Collybiopsis confluens TaxID=2823264 RepID=A0A8H5H6K1_9AGAR|nr:hypothetical protein D9757_008002 [Collybiopsis confluens]
MFSIRFASVLLLVSTALATPLSAKRQPWNDLYVRGNSSQSSSSSSSNNNNSSNGSLNNYGGLSSMSGFDNFRGFGNFDGSQNAQVIVIQEKQTVCHTEQVQIIQQKLVVLQELAKKIITEQICEVETQTIVLEQFSSGFSSFQNDVGRTSGKQVGYDSKVASLVSNLTNSDGSLSTSDLGFNGTSVGSNTVVPSGNNWNDTDGPSAVSNAQSAAKAAASASNNSTSSS